MKVNDAIFEVLLRSLNNRNDPNNVSVLIGGEQTTVRAAILILSNSGEVEEIVQTS